MFSEYVRIDQTEKPGRLRDTRARPDGFDLESDSSQNSLNSEGGRQRTALHRVLVVTPWAIITSSVLLSIFLVGKAIFYPSHATCTIKSNTYTPVEDLVGYKNVMFTQRTNGAPYGKYEGLSDDVEQNWSNLYNFGMSMIPMSMAKKLVNETLPIPGDTDHYIVELNVFHELHCLNMLRRRLWTPHEVTDAIEPNDMAQPTLAAWHLSHCLDNFRQSLMCTVDVTPLPLTFDPDGLVLRPDFNVQHACKDFDAISKWGMENPVHGFDRTVHVGHAGHSHPHRRRARDE